MATIEQRLNQGDLVIIDGAMGTELEHRGVPMDDLAWSGAAVIDYPVLDTLRYIEFGSARFWTDEFGDPAAEADFEVLHDYSPYRRAQQAACLPPTLVRAGEFDTTTTPMHAYKFVAAAQASQTCADPVMLDLMEGAGHDYGRTPEQGRKSHAVALEFLYRNLDYAPWRD